MTELRKRMIESLQLRGLSERTQEAYVRAVRQLADHYHKSPDLITEEELRQYFLHIKNVKKYSRASSTIAICGIKFFFEKTLNREFTTFKLVRAQREKKLPVILSVEEVLLILGRVRLPRYRVCLGTIYSCGLRLFKGMDLLPGNTFLDSLKNIGSGIITVWDGADRLMHLTRDINVPNPKLNISVPEADEIGALVSFVANVMDPPATKAAWDVFLAEATAQFQAITDDRIIPSHYLAFIKRDGCSFKKLSKRLSMSHSQRNDKVSSALLGTVNSRRGRLRLREPHEKAASSLRLWQD